jgi:hypothetical protein
MQFINETGNIHCIRTQHASSGGDEENIIATFHDQVDSVPPHVAAMLSADEISQLELWLSDQAKLKEKLDQQSAEKTLLEMLPAYIQKCTLSLEYIESIDAELYTNICQRIGELNKGLDKVSATQNTNQEEFNEMKDEEVLKEQLKSIKNSISDDSGFGM